MDFFWPPPAREHIAAFFKTSPMSRANSGLNEVSLTNL